MTDPNPEQSRNRFVVINAFRLLGTAGAVFGVILAAKTEQWPIKLLGGAIVLSALYMMWTIPAALAHRWRTPPQP